MTQHFTRSTVSATFYCPHCKRRTSHRIDDRRKGPCLECIARLDAERAKSKPVKVEDERQKELFA